MRKGTKHSPDTLRRLSKKLSAMRRGVPKTDAWKASASKGKLAERNPMWKGTKAGLDAIHVWVRARLPKPKKCQHCRKAPPFDLANKSGRYLRALTDWMWLCRRCHMLSDGRMKNLTSYRGV